MDGIIMYEEHKRQRCCSGHTSAVPTQNKETVGGSGARLK